MKRPVESSIKSSRSRCDLTALKRATQAAEQLIGSQISESYQFSLSKRFFELLVENKVHEEYRDDPDDSKNYHLGIRQFSNLFRRDSQHLYSAQRLSYFTILLAKPFYLLFKHLVVA